VVKVVHPPLALPSLLVPLEDLAVTALVATNLAVLVLAPLVAPLVLPRPEASAAVSLVPSPPALSVVVRAALSPRALPSPLVDLAVNPVLPPLALPSPVVASVALLALAASAVVRPAL
jgi:hypothetical protein